jgi:hypothetical protein
MNRAGAGTYEQAFHMLPAGSTMGHQQGMQFRDDSSERPQSVGDTCLSAINLQSRLDAALKLTVEQVSVAARDAFALGRAAHQPKVAAIHGLRIRLQLVRLRVEVLHHLLAAAETALASVDARYKDEASSHTVDAAPERAVAELADDRREPERMEGERPRA